MKYYILLLAIFFTFGFGCTKTVAPTYTPPEGQVHIDPQEQVTLEGYLSASNQAAGKTLTIDEVQVSKHAWIAIYASDKNRPGKILVATAVSPADRGPVAIALPNSSTVGEMYYILLHESGSEPGFNFMEDDFPSDATKATSVEIVDKNTQI
ncbi:MAG: hypothetical protein HOE53_02940 [Candidatus Magasanikbacteria bacterium]|jgi:hypothetical protein|nr:hypothetical protein [Candidatus Magasanikbacteria bacterium]